MIVAVTGASGYVGGILCRALESKGHDVRAWSRRPCPGNWSSYDIQGDHNGLPWTGVEALVHAAYDFAPKTWPEILAGNVNPSIELLKTACDHGVKRLVFISSISSFDGARSNYGKAKRMIEHAALDLGAVVIRPGLVWGERSGGVMGALEKLVKLLPVIPTLSGRGGLPQYLVHEEDLSATVAQAVESTDAGFILEATNPDPLPLKRILSIIAKRGKLRRHFIPVPWQIAMTSLKTAELIGIKAPFRSDSLTGLVHGTKALLNSNPDVIRQRYRPFA